MSWWKFETPNPKRSWRCHSHDWDYQPPASRLSGPSKWRWKSRNRRNGLTSKQNDATWCNTFSFRDFYSVFFWWVRPCSLGQFEFWSVQVRATKAIWFCGMQQLGWPTGSPNGTLHAAGSFTSWQRGLWWLIQWWVSNKHQKWVYQPKQMGSLQETTTNSGDLFNALMLFDKTWNPSKCPPWQASSVSSNLPTIRHNFYDTYDTLTNHD